MGLLAAIRFLTIVPVPLKGGARPEDLAGSSGFFPLVGLLLGLVLVGLDKGLAMGLPSSIVNGLLLVALVAVTGAIHVDGFVDTCDGLAGGKTHRRRLEIMRDSRVGAFGVTGALSLLLIKYLSLTELPASSRLEALFIVPAIGRWTVVGCIFTFPYARPEGLGKAFKQMVTWRTAVVAPALTLAFSSIFLGPLGLAVMFCTGAIALIAGTFLRGRFAGLTGDNYGAIVEVSEVSALLLVIALPPWGW